MKSHMTSSITWPIDSPCVISYWRSIVAVSSVTVFEISASKYLWVTTWWFRVTWRNRSCDHLIPICHHRLNGSSSPVLTATCLSYGSFCDFLTFFPEQAWGSDAPTDLHAKWLKWRGFAHRCAFCSKNGLFETPDPQTPKTAKICPILVGT